MRVLEEELHLEPDQYPGSLLGNYHLIRLLGKGGAARVYLAKHIYLERLVAVKVLPPLSSQESIERLRQEARLLARLRPNPHIVRVYEFGFEGARPFLVMDYAPYGNMRRRCPPGESLAPRVARLYLKQVAYALHDMHQQGLIHQDVKPDNLLLAAPEHLLLSDFGIARSEHPLQGEGLAMLGGTVPYMAPEQLRGRPCAASDQYALAVVLYEWLCGAPPFSGTWIELLYQHRQATPPPLRTRAPHLSVNLERVLQKALASEPEERYSDVWSFALAFEQALTADSARQPVMLVPRRLGPPTPAAASGQLSAAGSRPSARPPAAPARPRPLRAPAPPRVGRWSLLGDGLFALLVGLLLWWTGSGLYAPCAAALSLLLLPLLRVLHLKGLFTYWVAAVLFGFSTLLGSLLQDMTTLIVVQVLLVLLALLTAYLKTLARVRRSR
jgi:tRNA A-37 threonylcarbamoyl transferase component Bud32